MGAASESKIAAVCINTRLGVSFRIMLIEIGYSQPPTLLELDNTTAFSILAKQLFLKHSKAIDMRFFWLCDCTNQQ